MLSTLNCQTTRVPLNLRKYMSNNKLTNLKDIETLGSIENCSKSFAFDTNQIQTIPSQIRSINQFASLRINKNKLINLPSEIYYIKTLVYLDSRKNLFSPIKLESIVAKFNITNPSLILFY